MAASIASSRGWYWSSVATGTARQPAMSIAISWLK
jgi:hypothetical protein